MVRSMNTVIFTDLDGTLLDRETYRHDDARTALDLARRRGVPIVFCSSKTQAEQRVHRDRLRIRDPFIVEDGGAILIEPGTFQTVPASTHAMDNFNVVELGTPYEIIRHAIETVRTDTGILIKGYGDMSPPEVAEVTGLNREAASLAMVRQYQETIVSLHPPNELEVLRDAFARQGLRLTKGGRFLAVSGRHDKGAAVDVLMAMYRREFGEVRAVGIGDSYNDMSMLSAVDVPVLVQKQPNAWEEIGVPNLIRVDGVGPAGWNRFVSDFLANNP